MKVDKSQQGERVVLAVSGRLTAAGGDLLLREEVAKALAEGSRRFVLDFANLQTLDSSGLGELMSAATAVAEVGGRMVWSACPRTMSDLLVITRVEPPGVLFTDTADEAIELIG